MIEHNLITPREGSMAALALYGQLFNQNMGIRDILSEFIRIIFANNPSKALSDNDVATSLKEGFGFIVPLSVIKNIISRDPFLEFNKATRTYQLKLSQDNEVYITQSQDALQGHEKDVEEIFSRFIAFVEAFLGQSLSPAEHRNARTALYTYLVSNNKSENYRNYIEQFILSCKDNQELLHKLQSVQNGIILFEGVCYDGGNPQEVSKFMKCSLVIYLDTEILYNAVGYNGELCKKLFLEFYECVQSINQATQKLSGGKNSKKISLMYTGEVEAEIEQYFQKASELLAHHQVWTADKTAMRSILDGCRSIEDVNFRETGFWREIHSLGIRSNDTLWEASKLIKEYNVESEQFKLINLDEESQKKINHAFDQLNIVNHERKSGEHSYLGNCKAIYVSQSHEMLSLARKIEIDDKAQDKSNMRLCVPMQYVTARLWYQTVKGVGLSNPAISFSILAKAQLVAARKTDRFLGEKLQKLQEEAYNLSQEEINGRLAGLRSIKTKAEDITLEEWAHNDESYAAFLENENYKKNQTFALLEETKQQRDNEILLRKQAEESRGSLQLQKANLEKLMQEKDVLHQEERNRILMEVEDTRKEIARLRYEQAYSKWEDKLDTEKSKEMKRFKTRLYLNVGLIILFLCCLVAGIFVLLSKQRITGWIMIGCSVLGNVGSLVALYFAPANRKEIHWTFTAILRPKETLRNHMQEWEEKWIHDNPVPMEENVVKKIE